MLIQTSHNGECHFRLISANFAGEMRSKRKLRVDPKPNPAAEPKIPSKC
jgi:hypothetical protein